MGIFSEAFMTGWKRGRNRAKNESYRRQEEKNRIPVKLVEPTTGKVVRLEVVEKNKELKKLYLEQLRNFAEGLVRQGVEVKWSITDSTLEMVFADEHIAESVRDTWKN